MAKTITLCFKTTEQTLARFKEKLQKAYKETPSFHNEVELVVTDHCLFFTSIDEINTHFDNFTKELNPLRQETGLHNVEQVINESRLGLVHTNHVSDITLAPVMLTVQAHLAAVVLAGICYEPPTDNFGCVLGPHYVIVGKDRITFDATACLSPLFDIFLKARNHHV